MDLVGIFPSPEIGRDILCYPDEESNEQECDIHVHGADLVRDCKVDFRFPEQCENCEDQEYSEIIDVMMREKIEVNEDSEHDTQCVMVIIHHLQLHYPPCLADIASNRRVHESAIERHCQYLEEAFFRIAP